MSTNPDTVLDPPAGDPPANPDPANPPSPPADPAAGDPPASDPPAADPPADPGDEGTKSDWRTEMAGDDKEFLKYLGRFQSKDSATKGIKKLNDDLKSGKFIKPLDENSTDEEKAAFNKALGVPEKAEDYLTALPNGLVVGEDDKPFVDKFAQNMLAANAPKAAVDAALETYYGIVEEQEAAQHEANQAARQQTEDSLREEWGPEFRRNVNVLKGAFDNMPDGLGETLLGAVGADGVQIANNPAFMKWVMAQTLLANPLATVVPGTGATQAAGIHDEIKQIEAKMGTKEYLGDEKMQARYRDLVDAREKLGGN